MSIPFTREQLYDRHRLSHQQINDWLGEADHIPRLEEKIDQIRRVHEFLNLTQRFQEAGLWFVPVKGPLLSYSIYGDATCRRSHDFDFLVKPADIFRAIQILTDSGYRSDYAEWPKDKAHINLALSMLHEFSLFNASSGMSIDIHRSLFEYPFPQEKIDKLIGENLRQVEFSGQKFRQFTPEFELLYLIIHGGLHAWSRLKWLVDVHEMVNRKQVDYLKFQHIARQLNAGRMVSICNFMLRHFFPDSPVLPEDRSAPGWMFRFSLLQATREKEVPVSPPLNFLKFVCFRMLAFPGLKYKGKALGVLIFSAQDIRHTWLPPSPFLFMIYRPFGYLFRAFGSLRHK